MESRNRADQAVYGAEKFVKESGEKLDPADRMAIESAVNDVKKALESTDTKAIDRTLDALMQAQQKAGEKLYTSAGQGAPGGDGPSADAGAAGAQSDDVIDAEVVEEKK